MRIVFIGTPEFAVPSLSVVCKSFLDVCMVLTKPDARRGRGRELKRCPVKDAALNKGLMVYQPRRACSEQTYALFSRLRPDAGIVVAFGEVFKEQFIDSFPMGLFNVHASLLPEYRGAAPANYALMKGETQTGVTVQRVVPDVDAGPVIAQKKTEIQPEENAGELQQRLALLGAECLEGVVQALATGEKLTEKKQNGALATYAPKLSKQDGRIDWERGAAVIVNHIRAMTPWPGAFCRYSGSEREEKVTLLKAALCAASHDAGPGQIVGISDDEHIVVAAGDGLTLAVETLKPAGGRRMSAGDFIHGRRVKAGDRFE